MYILLSNPNPDFDWFEYDFFKLPESQISGNVYKLFSYTFIS